MASKQSHGEPVREFYANIKAAAAACKYEVNCIHACCAGKSKIDYTPNVVKDILIVGIADAEIQKDLLGWEELDSKNDKEVLTFIESKEIAQTAMNKAITTGTAGLSAYRKAQKKPDEQKTLTEQKDPADQSLTSKLSLKGKCAKCRKDILLFKRYQNGNVNKTAFTHCRSCHRLINQSTKADTSGVSEDAPTSSVESFFIGGLECPGKYSCPPSAKGVSQADSAIHAITLDHHIFTPEGWQRASALSHPTLRLRMTTHQEDYQQFGISYPAIAPKHVDVVIDSGAQSVLCPRETFLKSGFSLKDLIPVRHIMKAANTAPISIDGAILIRLSGTNTDGKQIEAAVMAYVSPDANHFYLSREAMVQLQIIDKSFPRIGGAVQKCPQNLAVNASEMDDIETDQGMGESVTKKTDVQNGIHNECGCLKRNLPPVKPTKLPFPCTEDNAESMKAWLLNYYASSTFNKCPHQILPEMEGPPVQIHVDPNAKPLKLTKPAPVPLHFQEAVEEGLKRDIAMGVLEKVPLGETPSWVFRMNITRKDDGSPRRTIDISPMNKHCTREVHSFNPPFNLARSVPDRSVKTVFDAWNGYHSMPVRPEDRHLLTFSTSIGLLRYKRAPQGFVSSGDGYNRRYDDLTSHIARLERCVDDSLLHDNEENLEQHWWRVIEYIDLCGRSGIVLNPEKFQFSQSTVDFAGFRITKDSVEPLPKYLDAIRGFPTPKTTTDVRSWWGLVNQVSHYSQLRDMMSPFRRFLSPKEKFEWTPELDKIFEESKVKILDAIREGVKIFDLKRQTCLRTDWSKKGIGYFLSQKHCDCSSQTYGCCPDGWKVTLAGSRFLTPAEQNYAAIEGEALGVAWALEQTQYFTMGCDNLVVIVDHKPLVKIFGDRRLDEIDNPRLFRMKQRTLRWRFEIQYQRGKTNPFADAMSRHPNSFAELASVAMMTDHDRQEESYVLGTINEAERMFAITWENIKIESQKDTTMCLLNEHIHNGFPNSKKELAEEIRSFWEVRESLRCFGAVILYKDRIVIPPSLQAKIVENLHSAHQGVSSMYSRAQTIVYWPGLVGDLENAREACRLCHQNAPSHARLPPTAPAIPTTPFQMIFADYFQLRGNHYLVIGDRLSGWSEILQMRKNQGSSGAKGLCEALRRIFATFGVPEEISSDGGPEFVAMETMDFLTRWGIRHRLSSAYLPQSNGRAEVAVKVAKRLLEDNTTADGTLNTDEMVRALLQHRNTPDRDCKLSPAEVLFGRVLPDSMPQLAKEVPIFGSDMIHTQWHQAWEAKEEAIKARLVRSCEQLEPGSNELPPLREGNQVFIQNQSKINGRQTKWDRQGTIIACKDNDQYLVKVHGTGRLTLRNRRFLRKFELRKQTVQPAHAVVGMPNLIPQKTSDPVTDRQEQKHHETTQQCPPELMHQVDKGECENRATAPDVSPEANDAPQLMVEERGAEVCRDELPLKRGRGRPPKKHVNFDVTTRPLAMQQDTPQNMDGDAQSRQQEPMGSDRPNWREPDSIRPVRQRQQRQVYDAASGCSKNPSG